MPNFQYSYTQYTDMVLAYGMAEGDQSESLRLYLDHFNHRKDEQVPSNGRVLMRVVQRLRDYGSFSPRNLDSGGEKNYRIRDSILEHFEENPDASTRSAGRTLKVPPSTVHSVLKENLKEKTEHLSLTTHIGKKYNTRKRKVTTDYNEGSSDDDNS